jgi:hypothetical protein
MTLTVCRETQVCDLARTLDHILEMQQRRNAEELQSEECGGPARAEVSSFGTPQWRANDSLALS